MAGRDEAERLRIDALLGDEGARAELDTRRRQDVMAAAAAAGGEVA